MTALWAVCLLLQEETHGSVPLLSTIHGLKHIYRDWGVPQDLLARADIKGIENHAKRLTERFGYEIKVPENMVNQLGYNVMGNGDLEKAVEILTWNTEQYPESANVYDSLGEAYEAKGNFDKALKQYRKAVKRGEAIADPNVQVYQDHIDRVKQKMGNVS